MLVRRSPDFSTHTHLCLEYEEILLILKGLEKRRISHQLVKHYFVSVFSVVIFGTPRCHKREGGNPD
jgi:hypothetical protein